MSPPERLDGEAAAVTTAAWIIGAGGLLGRALRRALAAQGVDAFVAAPALDWRDVAALPAQVEASLNAFAQRAASAGRWEIYWAAGVGSMGSDAAALAPESIALAALLDALGRHAGLAAQPGAFAFASSAGALHDGGVDVVTEDTEPMPSTAYGRAKLAQEASIRHVFAKHPRHLALLARISTLYGAGAAPGKPQGLLAHMAHCVLRSRPVRIYVPFDTIRDYIAVDDAAQALVSTLQRLSAHGGVQVRIVASETPVTIAEIVAIFKRVAHRTPRVTTSVSRLSAIYARQVRFRSAWRDDAPRRPLLIGIAQLLNDERKSFASQAPRIR